MPLYFELRTFFIVLFISQLTVFNSYAADDIPPLTKPFSEYFMFKHVLVGLWIAPEFKAKNKKQVCLKTNTG